MGGSQTNPGVKAAVAEVLPREDRSGGTRQDALAAPRSEQAVSSGGRAGLDDREGVAPRRPVSRVAVGAGTAQAEPTEPLRELGCPYCGRGQGGVKLQQAGDALCNGRIVVRCVGSCQVWGPYAQQVLNSGGGARLELQPCGLQVSKVTDALQQAVMLSALALEVVGNKRVVAERRSQHGETVTFGCSEFSVRLTPCTVMLATFTSGLRMPTSLLHGLQAAAACMFDRIGAAGVRDK